MSDIDALRVLIISMRYLGDCLLSASMASSVRKRYPDARIDLLTYQGNVGILKGVKDIDNIIVVEPKPSKRTLFKELLAVKGRYDWAVTAQDNVRSVLFARFAAKRQAMYRSQHAWRNHFISHTVEAGRGPWLVRASKLIEPVIGRCAAVNSACPDEALPPELTFDRPFVILQPCSRYEDKEWPVKHWRALIRFIDEAGFEVVITGGPGEDERKKIEAIARGQHPRILAGKLSFGQTARVIRQACAYVGVDTATTHVAAATGVSVITMYGPTDVKVWAPMPAAGLQKPVSKSDCFTEDVPVRTIGNVTVIRNENFLHCRDCTGHRCPYHRPDTLGRCMQTMGVEPVLKVLNRVLKSHRDRLK